MFERIVVKTLLGITDRVITKYLVQFDKLLEAKAKRKMRDLGVLEKQAELIKELNSANTEEERFAILSKINNFSKHSTNI